MLHRVTFANEQMMANLSRQHLPFTPSKLSQKCGGWYVVDRAIINKIKQAGDIPCGLAVHPTNMLLFSSKLWHCAIYLPICRLELI